MDMVPLPPQHGEDPFARLRVLANHQLLKLDQARNAAIPAERVAAEAIQLEQKACRARGAS